MNKKNNIILISNYRMHPRYYSHLSKSFITTDMLTLKIYSKRENKNILYFLIKFFIFTFLIWISQCSNNWNTYETWNYENNLKNILNLGDKRALAESNDTIKQKKGLQCHGQQGMMTINLESNNEQIEIEQNLNAEHEDEIETKEKNKKVKLTEKILSKCKNNLKLVASSFAFFSSLFLVSLIIASQFTYNVPFHNFFYVLPSLSLVIISIILTHERIEIKYKNKF
ncbi:fam-h protein [Plasmodium relictum]|uniref:Fam-h protein n=1 Tax=Plasmodium relictum TaxID=85471 RepID=A0A1J1GKB5_PLARL|nr:fam-h protein [Plasmodium relictum]CRG84954.1 fam-h protein [Plasmodium relictum]